MGHLQEVTCLPCSCSLPRPNAWRRERELSALPVERNEGEVLDSCEMIEARMSLIRAD